MFGDIKKELGDYQTPLDFAEVITEFVKKHISFYPSKIVEPTCGVGNFLLASYKKFNESEIIGIDINKNYLSEAKEKIDNLGAVNYKLINENIFYYNYEDIINDDKVLIIGNPPWVTNSYLTNGKIKNLPNKSNFKNHNGFEAMTGSSNFDICEYIILDALGKIKSKRVCLAMLCKTNVAINVIKELRRQNNLIQNGIILKFNTKEIFNVSADACLLFIEKNTNICSGVDKFKVYNFENNKIEIQSQMGFVNGDFVINCDSYVSELDGSSPFEWRQGVKHDSSKIMELTLDKTNRFINGYGEVLNIEDTLVYPLIKSSDIKRWKDNEIIRKHVIITQHKVGEDTGYIKKDSPKLWDYLNLHAEKLTSRKSSIYKNAPKFSIFGIGEYSFSKYKVAISGFYKDPLFVMLKSEKSIMLDDTCYFLSFDDEKTAKIATIVLNSDIVREFLLSITNVNSKRPYTKKILSRIDLKAACNLLDFKYLQKSENDIFHSNDINEKDYKNFIKSL